MFIAMNEEDYLKKRVEQQIEWYDSKSQKAQKYFKALRGFEICAAASIPLIAGFGGTLIPVNLTVAVLGALIAISTAITSLNQYQENWIKYRTTCELLKQEKFLFLTRSELYQDKNPYTLFVQKIESLISKENTAWSQYTSNAVDNSKPQTQS